MIVGVALLVFVRPAEAEIVYTPVNVTIHPQQHYHLDLNNDGVTDFTISNDLIVIDGQCLSSRSGVYETPAAGNGTQDSPPADAQLPADLKEGDEIGPDQAFGVGQRALVYANQECGPYQTGGRWNPNGNNGYLGLMFQINGETHYGWAELHITYTRGKGWIDFYATLTGYAYETIPGMPINAGQTTEAGASSAFSSSPANRNDFGRSEAAIVYTPENVTISGDGIITLPKNGPVQFTIQAAHDTGSCGLLGRYSAASVLVTSTTGDGVVAGSGVGYAAALSNGDPIGPGQSFAEGQAFMAEAHVNSITCGENNFNGYWCNGENLRHNTEPCHTVDGYLGLELEFEGSTHYGWAHIVVTPVQNPEEFTVHLTGYAYETVPGMPISAGQTSDGDGEASLTQ